MYPHIRKAGPFTQKLSRTTPEARMLEGASTSRLTFEAPS
ncbi:hypothetical protein NBRC111894_356 [Sporolactobacillus inulinus]|uniref:Uncharacterized protein n=1 Tax=Sporolactobacillus inulinus TaxID=2078 RepID=A0A4Y1Z6Y4_9BACL|nr:hypothetical protein NBRC111894_356 [Sporolactobacillus inulinus]